MASPASSPPKSTTASSSSSMLLQPQCVCSLQEIIDQRQNEEEYVRFQCLAHTRFGRSPIQRRCGASFKLQVRPQVFERAKDYLRRTSPISILDYLQFVVRILFCRTHSESNAYRKFQDLLQKHWTGEGTPKETLLLDAIRKAFQLPPLAIVQMHNAREGFSSSPKSSKLGFLGPDMQPQTYAKSSETDQISRASLEAAQSTSSIDSSSLERKTLLPKPPSQRVKSVSHPAKQRDECIALPKPSSILAAENAHNIPFTLQQIKSKPLEGPELRQKATSSSIPEARSTSTWGASSNAMAENFSFHNWDISSFSSSHNSFEFKHSPFKATRMVGMSKDDSFIDELSKSVAKTTPSLYEPSIQYSLPDPDAKSKNDTTLIPVIIDTYIREAIKKPVTKEGSAYILKAPEYFEKKYPGETPLVKIGVSTDVPRRINDLRKSCGLFGLEQVEDNENIRHRLYYKVEELVHTELANFNRLFKCGRCKTKGKDTEHREWFAVSEEVALTTVQRWRSFVLLDPPPYDDNGILTDHWSEMLEIRNVIWQQGGDERYDDHEKRNSRWERWLQEEIRATNRITYP